MKVKVKFCGLTRFEDARFALDLGVDALGFNFFEKSPRFVSIAQAQTIVRQLPAKAMCVGVFVNHTEKQVIETARRVPLDALQFHGDESPDFCAQFRDEWIVIKAIRLREDISKEEIESYASIADHLLFDSYDKFLYGGSGKEIEQAILANFDAKELFKNAFLSGGLSPENVASKVALYRPYGLDVASGIESAPGIKDRVLMSRFVEALS